MPTSTGPSSSRRTILIVVAAALAAWLVNAVLLWAPATPLGHDESQYAIAAQDRLEGGPVRWSYLSIGMNPIAIPGVLAGGGEHALRAAPVLLGVAFLLVAALLARAVFGLATAAWALAVLAASSAIAKRGADLLSDLPAAACLLAGTALIVIELTREPAPRRRLLLVAPCFAAAFYIRYGSILPIAAIGGIGLLVGWRAVLRRPWLALATIALFAVLLIPFFRHSIAETGTALGIFRDSSNVLGNASMAESLITYATSNPFKYYGIVTAPVMLAGLVAIRRARDPRILMLWLMAIADIVAIGLTPVAQARYIFFGIALLVILGTDEIRCWLIARQPRVRRALGALAVTVIAGSWIFVAISSIWLGATRTRRAGGTIAAATAIRDDARGAPCVVLGRRTTQLQWYSGCIAALDVQPDVIARERVYMVIEPGGPDQPNLTGYPGRHHTLRERAGTLTVLRLVPPPQRPTPPT